MVEYYRPFLCTNMVLEYRYGTNWYHGTYSSCTMVRTRLPNGTPRLLHSLCTTTLCVLPGYGTMVRTRVRTLLVQWYVHVYQMVHHDYYIHYVLRHYVYYRYGHTRIAILEANGIAIGRGMERELYVPYMVPYVLIMLCHNFLIGKGHTCALRTTCVLGGYTAAS